MGILSALIWLPIAGGLLVLAVGNGRADGTGLRLDRWLALGVSVVTFLLSVPLFTQFDRTTWQMQFVERLPWIEAFRVEYFLGIDGLSMPLILLTTFLTPLVVIAGWETIKIRPAQYFASFLFLEGLMIGVFAALDALLFYVFWEAMLVPMFIIIGVWGGERRVYATVKFFLYTFLGSVLMLVALIYLYLKSGSYSILDFHALPLGQTEQLLIFLAFLVAFAVKVPMWPVHTWLPDAHVEAPTGGSVILAAVLLKMGGYGFVRFSLPITPDAAGSLAFLMIVLSLVAVVYIGMVALVQQDMKKLIAYSSVAHMGYVTLGIFAATHQLKDKAVLGEQAVQGAIFQMLSHGVVSAALFLVVGVVYDRMHTRMIARYGGLVERMPRYAFVFMVMMLASVGLPGTSGFVGEFLVLLGAFQANVWVGVLATSGVVLGCTYMLWLYRRVIFGKLVRADLKNISDLNIREIVVFAPLVVLVIWMGVYPSSFLEIIEPSVKALVSDFKAGICARDAACFPGVVGSR